MKKTILAKAVMVIGTVLMVIASGDQSHAADKGYPNRQIEFVVPYPPGGSLDVTVRAMNEELTKNFGIPTIVINKSAGSSSIGTEYVAHARPDGYTLLVGNNAIFVTVPATTSANELPYKVSDFIPLARVGDSPNLFFVRKDAPWKTIEELIAYAKKNPGRLKCSTTGPTGSTGFSLEMLKSKTGVDIQPVPFAGGPLANSALLGGHVDMLASTLSGAVIGLMKSGDIRALLVSTEKRMESFPDIPTQDEKGLPGASIGMWVGFFAPKGVEKSIIDKVKAAIEKTAKNPDVIKKIVSVGNVYRYMSSEETAKSIDQEHKMVTDIIKKANLTFK